VVFGYLLYLRISCVGDMKCVLFCVVCWLSVFVCYVLFQLDLIIVQNVVIFFVNFEGCVTVLLYHDY
jgi:hypothetical protein